MIHIGDNEILLRRLHPGVAFLPDGTVTSAAFKGGKGAFSVDIESMTSQQESVDRAQKVCYRLGQMKASHPRGLKCEPTHDPELDNPAHAFLANTRPKIPRSLSRALAGECFGIDGVWSSGSDVEECLVHIALHTN